jgi:prepilin-type processing-associated H-X9-DG protein
MPPATTHNTSPRTLCRNNLKSIALALYEYMEVYGAFPPAYTVDADGKPLHSWRTLLLPYLDQRELFESIDLSKSWDDPVNAKAFKQMPAVYQCPLMTGGDHRTLYLGVGVTGGFFSGATPRKMGDITDKQDETLMVVEVHADQGVPWMAPMDADEKLIEDVDPKSEGPHLGGRNVAFVDGGVRILNTSDTTVADLKRMMTIAGGD